MCSFNFQYIQPKNARMPIKRQTEAILPIFNKALSVFDSCFSTYTLSFDILFITEIKESHLL